MENTSWELELMQELERAIRDVTTRSDRIAAIVGEIEAAGYDVGLCLTARFRVRDEQASEFDGEQDDLELQQPLFDASGRLNLTEGDHAFLQALKIAG